MIKNIRRIKYKIPSDFNGKYLKDFLQHVGYSNDLIKHLKQTVSLDAFHLLSTNEEVVIDIVEDENSDNIVPNGDLKFNILYEDDDLIVVDKPKNMPIHPSQNNYDNTLGNALKYYYHNIQFVYRPITRLDKDTTGCCIIAKNKLSASSLSKMLQNNEIKRNYIGIVKGNIYDLLKSNPEFINAQKIHEYTHLDFLIDIPIKREEDSTIKRTIDPNGELAITKVIAYNYNEFYNISTCKFQLRTGRTHQIRVHMSNIGFPIIGDTLYNDDKTLIDRQALHSNEIIFKHPITMEMIRVISKIPDDMKKLI